jgi:hypothetical protein
MKWRCDYQHPVPSGSEQGTFEIEAPSLDLAISGAYAALAERGIGDGERLTSNVQLRVIPEDGSFEKPLFEIDTGSENRPGKVICVAILPVILAGLTPEESWRLLAFLFITVITVLAVAFVVVDCVASEKKHRELMRERKKQERRMRMLRPTISSPEPSLWNEEPGPIELLNEANSWGGEQP